MHNKFRIIYKTELNSEDEVIIWANMNCNNVRQVTNFNGIPDGWKMLFFEDPRASFGDYSFMQLPQTWQQIKVEGLRIGKNNNSGPIRFLKERVSMW